MHVHRVLLQELVRAGEGENVGLVDEVLYEVVEERLTLLLHLGIQVLSKEVHLLLGETNAGESLLWKNLLELLVVASRP